MAEYRWNIPDYAVGFDAAAEYIHPHYLSIQDVILDLLPLDQGDDFLLVDAGGGSGRLAERFLRRFERATAVVLDQSPAFLALAERRLASFGERASCLVSRLQDPWAQRLSRPPAAIVSMSAIHHLDPDEKQELYRACYHALVPGGVLLNGDEIRASDDAAYLADLQKWAAHKNRMIEAGLIPEPVRDLLHKWQVRNIDQFGSPKKSGDDCHETVAAQCAYLSAAGFSRVDVPWQQDMWAVIQAVK